MDSFWLSQQTFIPRLKDADPTEILKDKKLRVPVDKLKTFYRRHLGNLIRCLQTRFDVGFAVAEFATSSPYIVSGAQQILGVVEMINRIINTLRNRVVEICFGGFFDSRYEVTREQLGSIRLFIFSDAGCATLQGRRSVEAEIVIAGREITRDGSIVCRGTALDFYSRKIGRVVRSTIAAEAVALANAIEVGLWHHAILTEIVTGEFVDLRPNREDTFPLRTPFRAYRDRESSSQEVDGVESLGANTTQCSAECRFGPRVDLFSERGTAELLCSAHSCRIDGGPIYACQSGCVESSCSAEADLCLFPVHQQKWLGNVRAQPELAHPNLSEKEAMTLMKVVALSDCANIFSAVSNWQPRSIDKLTNLSLWFIRDLSQQIHFSFLDAEFNVADTSTKNVGNKHLYYLLRDTRRFVLSFVGRKKLKLEKAADLKMKEKSSEKSTDQKR